jgi:HlyD family secretion protein
MALTRNKKIIIGSVILLTSLVVVLAAVFAGRKDAAEITVTKLEKKIALKSTVTSSGEVRPIQYINLTSEVQGRIEEIYVQEGQEVTKGQQLVRLDPTQLQSSQDAQTAAYQGSRDDLQVTRSQVIAAQNQYSQSQQSLVATEAAVTTAQQQVSSAQESVNQARQQVVSSQTDVDRAVVEVNAASRELKRTIELVESGVAPKLEYDQAKDRVENAAVGLRNAKARLDSQKIGITEAQNRVKEAQTRVTESRARVNQQRVAVKDASRGVESANFSVKAGEKRSDQQAAVLRGQTNQRDKTLQVSPINGIVAEIPSKAGTFAVAGFSTTALMTIADMSGVNVEVKIDETSIDKVKVGQTAKVKVDALGENELEGEVLQKTPLALGKSQQSGGLSTNINTQEAKEFRVVIQLKNLDEAVRKSLRPGMSATAAITTDTAKDLLAVPIQAIVEKLPESEKTEPTPEGLKNNLPSLEKPKSIRGVFVFMDKKAKFVEVETGITGESDIQITSGLEEGQEIITGPSKALKSLKDGDSVTIQVKKDAAAAK